MTRTLCWFSCGAASAVATKLLISTEAHDDLVIVYADTGSEHPDSERFLSDCEQWFGQEVVRIGSTKYASTWEVWESRRYLAGPAGAPCTGELKKKPRYAFERPDDLHIFGYTADTKDADRALRFVEQNPGVDARFPLIERDLHKRDCLAMIERAGIAIPTMYLLGYQNNNCIGCVKGGMGYWNKIRVDFPETFDRMAKLERDIGASCLTDDAGPVYLDELDPARGNYADEIDAGCSLACASAEADIESVQ